MASPPAQLLRIEYRNAPSFLVAYSISFARGGVFVETRLDLPVGTPVEVQLAIPSGGLIDLRGTVTYQRTGADEDGHPGLALELPDAAEMLAQLVNRLAIEYGGMSIIVLAGDTQDRTTLSRQLKSILTTAEVISATDARLAEAVLDDDIDLVVLDADHDLEASLETIKMARDMPVPVPTVALTSSRKAIDRLLLAGANEVANNPPAFAELQQVLVRAMARPRRVS